MKPRLRSRLLTESQLVVGDDVGPGPIRLFGRDVQPACGVLAVLRSSKTERYVAFYAWRKRNGSWDEDDVFEGGVRWPLVLPRADSERRSFRYLSGIAARGRTESEPAFLIRAGAVTPSVQRVEVSSPLDRHAVRHDPQSGLFVFICLAEFGMDVELRAYSSGGEHADTVDFRIEPVDWDEPESD